MKFLDALEVADENDDAMLVLEEDEYRVSTFGFLEEFVENRWVPVILTVNDYLSEDWEVKTICHKRLN